MRRARSVTEVKIPRASRSRSILANQSSIVQPRRVGRGEVQSDLRMRHQERADRLCLVRREIVEDDVHFPRVGRSCHDLGQERDEGGAGVTRDGLAGDLAGALVQRREQGEGAVPVVLEAVAFRPSGRQRQDGVETIEGLNGRLLIDGEHGGVLRRVEVQPDDIGRFRFEVGSSDAMYRSNRCGCRPARCQALATWL